MALKDVIVTIDLKKSSGLLGFGKPLILGVITGGRSYKEYSTIEEVKKDYDGTTSGADAEIKKIYNIAKAIFDQEHAPSKIAIVCSNDEKTTEESYALTSDSSVDSSKTYYTRSGSAGNYTYTKVSNPTASNISTYYEKTEGTKGLEQILADNYERDFYFVLSTTDDSEVKKDIAELVNTNGRKIFVTRTVSDVELGQLSEGKYERTIICYHTTNGEYMDAALVGECGSQEVGSITWKFKKLFGITAENFTETELETIHSQGAIAYVTKAGDNQTSEGIVVSGEYIDIVHSKDYVQFNIEYKVQKLFNKTAKVPYTNTGIAMIENEVINVLQSCYNSGIIAESDEGKALFSTNFPKRSEVSQADRTAREYNVGAFEFELAGAVHEAKIYGNIIV